MDKNKIKEKAREAAKFTYEVIDDIFGKRILIFAYILVVLFAGTALFQVFTKYVYEEGFSTADALVATIIHPPHHGHLGQPHERAHHLAW